MVSLQKPKYDINDNYVKTAHVTKIPHDQIKLYTQCCRDSKNHM